MNTTAVLGLMAALYEQIVSLEEQNTLLRRALNEATQSQDHEAKDAGKATDG